MRTTLLTLLFGLALTMTGAVWAQVCDTGMPDPERPEAAAAFDFLVGEHEITLHAWTGSTWSPPRPVNARWRGWHGLQGQAIYDEWIDPDPHRGSLGVNVRLYDPTAEVWHMMWISTRGRQVQELRANWQEGVLTMWQIHPERPGWKAVFSILSDSQWAREDFTRDDQGVWQPGFRLVATRQACAPD